MMDNTTAFLLGCGTGVIIMGVTAVLLILGYNNRD